jgi:uncharacterized membrane-anchored protein
MKKNKLYFLIVVGVWLLIGGGLIFKNEFTLSTGQEVLLSVRPVDPTDLFRGSYMALNYDISNISSIGCNDCAKNNFRGDIYVGLKVGKNGIAVPSRVYASKPGGLFIKGRTPLGGSRFLSGVEYGIESYFFRQGDEAEITSLLRRGACAKVYVDRFGRAVLKDLVPCVSNSSTNAMLEAERKARRQQAEALKAAAASSTASSTAMGAVATSSALK